MKDPTEVVRKYYHTDHQGSVTALSIGNQLTPDTKYSYDAYGIPNSDELDSGGQPFRYTGRRWDEETGLYYYRARYYNARLGRFLQVDPIGYEDNNTRSRRESAANRQTSMAIRAMIR